MRQLLVGTAITFIMSQKLPPGSPLSHKVVVGILAVAVGIFTVMKTGKDFEFIKYEPHSPEEVERRKKEKTGLQVQYLNTCTLNYKPEAKQRIDDMFQRKLANEQQDSDR